MKKIILPLFVLIVMNACVPRVAIDYLVVSVPEEGALKLVKYTDENESVVHPSIIDQASNGFDRANSTIFWYAPALLAISPDETKIAYLAASNGYHNLYLKDISGGKSTIQRTFNRQIMDMSYSPNGSNIVFTESKDNDYNIFMINASEGVAVQQLVRTNAFELSPTFSADGKGIFFVKNEGNNYYIWSFNIESSLLTQYTEGFTPTLSPNGEDLIVTRNSRDGKFRGEIWMVNTRKGTETLILSDPKIGYSSPRISPNGKEIVCVGITEGDKSKPMNLDLYTVKIDGTNLTQLTFHGGHDVSPVWSPSGNSIFFLSQRGNKDGKYNVWKMEYSNLKK